MKTRVLHFSTPQGSVEYVIFTQDLEGDAENYKRQGFELIGDNVLDVEMPAGFPLDYELKRK
jgi:hypothetical protein